MTAEAGPKRSNFLFINMLCIALLGAKNNELTHTIQASIVPTRVSKADVAPMTQVAL
jgi:hypothetical protein